MRNIILFLSLIVLPFSGIAHEDTPLKLMADGRLIGLPEKYDAAYFDMESFSLCIGKKKIVVPECLTAYFENYQNYDVSFSASWYHDTELLPFYIHMELVSADEPYGYELLFNLETLEIFKVSKGKVVLAEGRAHLYRSSTLEISNECQQQISGAVEIRNN